jgi:hypothetical protein
MPDATGRVTTDDRLADAALALPPGGNPRDSALAARLADHVRALAADAERLESERDRFRTLLAEARPYFLDGCVDLLPSFRPKASALAKRIDEALGLPGKTPGV